jgi:hypothetical protein
MAAAAAAMARFRAGKEVPPSNDEQSLTRYVEAAGEVLVSRATAAVTELQAMQQAHSELLQNLPADPMQTLQRFAQDLAQRRWLNPVSVASDLASLPVWL